MSKELIERLRRIEGEERDMGRRHMADLLDECRGALIAQEPLTSEQIEALPVWIYFLGLLPESRQEITRAIELAHGIGGKP